jgi:cytochrome bd-type quinol oxidase subunit 1
MREFKKYELDEEAQQIWLFVVVLDHPLPLLPYVKGWSSAAVARQEVTIFQAAGHC